MPQYGNTNANLRYHGRSRGGTGRTRRSIYCLVNADGSLPLFDPMQGINADVRASNVPVELANYFGDQSLRAVGGNAFNRSYRWRDSNGTMRQVYMGVNVIFGGDDDVVALEFTNSGRERFYFAGTNTYNTPLIQAVWNEFITLDLAIFVFGSAEAVILNDDTQNITRAHRAFIGGLFVSNIASNVDLQSVFRHLPDGTRTQLSVGQLQELTTLALALPASGGNTSTGWQLTPPDDPTGRGVVKLDLTLADEFHGWSHPSGEPIIVGVGLPRIMLPAPVWTWDSTNELYWDATTRMTL